MRPIFKMLLRNILKEKIQILAAISVIAIGITTFAAAFTAYMNLDITREYYYETYNFSDFSLTAKRLTKEDINQIDKMEEVKFAMPRLSIDVPADVSKDKRIYLRLLSYTGENKNSLNKINMIKGGINNKNKFSAIVNTKFANYYKINIGDSVSCIINQKEQSFKIDGFFESPEFINTIRSKSSVSPSAENFGILYVSEDTLRELFSMDTYYNELFFDLNENVNLDLFTKKIEKTLKNSGIVSTTTQSDQLSNKFFSNNIRQLRMIAIIFPVVFLLSAAIIIFTMLKRMIIKQRSTIGLLKALGYLSKTILICYMIFGLSIGFIGTIIGLFLGNIISIYITQLYLNMYDISVHKIQFYPIIFTISFFLSSIFTLVSTFSSTKRVIQISPAESMKSEKPQNGKRIIFERIPLFWSSLDFETKVSLRNLLRTKQRTILTSLGFIFAIALIMSALFLRESMDNMFIGHFYRFQIQDYKVDFIKPLPYKSIEELKKINHISHVEPVLELAIKLKNGWREEETLLVGIDERNSLYSLIDENNNKINPQTNGILVSKVLAERLNIKKGDFINIQYISDQFDDQNLMVTGILKQYTEFSCFINIDYLSSLLNHEKFVTSALITVDDYENCDISEKLYTYPNVDVLKDRRKDFTAFGTFTNLANVFLAVMWIFASIMGFSIIINTTIINVTERQREFSLYRVLGYTKRDIEQFVFKENVAISIISIGPGFILGNILCNFVGKAFISDLFEMDIIISLRTYGIAFLSLLIFSFVAQMIVRKNIENLNMLDTLKNRE